MNVPAINFDRLAYIDRLKSGGIDDEHARAHAAALDAALRDSVATTSDVEDLGIALRTEVADLGRELRTEMADLGRELRTEMADLGRDLRTEMAELGRELRTEMQDVRRELREIEVRLDAKIETAVAGVKVDILRWLVLTQVALGGFIFAVLRFLH